MPRTKVICTRMTPEIRGMLAELRGRWNTEDLSATIRIAIRFGFDAGYRRCMVCGVGLGPLLAEGVSDGLCEECNEAEIAKVKEWPRTTGGTGEGNRAQEASSAAGPADGQ